MLSKQKVDRLVFTLGVISIYRFATFVAVPGIDSAVLDAFYSNNEKILGFFNSLSGGAISRFSIMALGLAPYISSSIIMQLLVSIIPELKAFKKDSYQRRKITQYSRLLTVVLALGQSIGICLGIENIPGLVLNPGMLFRITTVASITSSSLLTMWLSERISERGIGNGSSMIIFTGIISNATSSLALYIVGGKLTLNSVLFTSSLIILFSLFIAFCELIRYVIPIFFKRSVEVFSDDSDQKYDSLPIKINPAGILPTMFADNAMVVPNVLIKVLESNFGLNLSIVSNYLPIIAKAFLIAFFSTFCLSLVMNPEDVAENMKSRGAYINGISEGAQTSRYLENLLNKISIIGCAYLVSVSIFPDLIALFGWGIGISGTSLLMSITIGMEIYDRLAPEPKEISE
jgi:preprotein translocase subunit SecY